MTYEKSQGPLRELCGVTVDPFRAGDHTLSPASSRLPVEAPNQRDKRGVFTWLLYIGFIIGGAR